MKYSNSSKPLACIQSQSTCYNGTKTFTPKGVLWHCTGANNPTLKRYVQPSDNAKNRNEMLSILGYNANGNDWNHIYVEAGVNAFIGKANNGDVMTVQTLPWNYRPWGCASGGKGSGNDTHIQFEMCEDALTDRDYFDKVYREGIELTAYLCQMYGIDPHGKTQCGSAIVPTIMCHQDAYQYGVGSNHGDVYNWFNRFGKTMDDVRNDVAALLVGAGQAQTQTQTHTAQQTTQTTDPQAFINKIAPIIQKIAPKYGIKCNSAVIAQACLESAYGTSDKAKFHNYFGLKYRGDRVKCASGKFVSSSKEQNADGTYTTIATDWYMFDNMEKGVEGYFQFINIDNYKNLKGIEAPEQYLEAIRKDGYATSLSYVKNVMAVVEKYNLRNYDPATETISFDVSGATQPAPRKDGLYRVRKSWNDAKSQIGAYRILENAKNACSDGYTVYDDTGAAVYTKAAAQTQPTTGASFKVRITCNALNIRSGPGTNNRVVGCIMDRGIYTIVQRVGDWGKLKSGAGWISLKYTQGV